jgi:hypothetical protein
MNILNSAGTPRRQIRQIAFHFGIGEADGPVEAFSGALPGLAAMAS